MHNISERNLFYCYGSCRPKAKAPVEGILPECSAELRDIYNKTREGNGQRWLMIDLESRGELYRDTLRLLEIRRNS